MIACIRSAGWAMKLAVGILVFVWLLCGVAGAWMMGDSSVHWKTIAKGPITLTKAFGEDRVN